MLYNPVSNQVMDQQRLCDKELRDKNRKRRYEMRQVADVNMREDGLVEQDRVEKLALRRFSFKQHEEQVTRGFNILTNGELPNSY
jgi:hypothetical protein